MHWLNHILTTIHWFWENCSVTLQQKLQKLQNRAARVICLEHVWNTLPIDDFKKKLRKNMINDENSM